MKLLTLILISLGLVFAGCKKDGGDAKKPAENTAPSKEEAVADNTKKAEKAPAEKAEAAKATDKAADKAKPAAAADKAKATPVAKEASAPAPGDLPAPADVKAAPADAEKTASGLASKVLKAGTGKTKPAATDTVTVHYTGWMTNGKMFDSSVKRGKPASFPLNGVIKGWTEGLQLMVEGEKRRFWIPGNLAYGDKQTRPGAPFGTLVFDVELVSIKVGPKPPATPKDVAAAPADAEKTKSGIASKVLKKGTGTQKATENDIATMHFSGWTSAGKLLDSSVMRGEPVTAPIKRMPPGWTEGIQLMTVGEKRRFWIPSNLAAPPGGNAPPGTLVFDIELISVKTAPKPPATPKDVAAAPADAEKSKSGLASKVLKKGTGDKKPTATSTVEVHYSGWTKDGKMFDSSITRGKTISFPLNRVIPGWTEGLQLMVVGEKRRLWIPSKMAYGDTPKRPGAPSGDLVFDVELVSIK